MKIEIEWKNTYCYRIDMSLSVVLKAYLSKPMVVAVATTAYAWHDVKKCDQIKIRQRYLHTTKETQCTPLKCGHTSINCGHSWTWCPQFSTTCGYWNYPKSPMIILIPPRYYVTQK